MDHSARLSALLPIPAGAHPDEAFLLQVRYWHSQIVYWTVRAKPPTQPFACAGCYSWRHVELKAYLHLRLQILSRSAHRSLSFLGETLIPASIPHSLCAPLSASPSALHGSEQRPGRRGGRGRPPWAPPQHLPARVCACGRGLLCRLRAPGALGVPRLAAHRPGAQVLRCRPRSGETLLSHAKLYAYVCMFSLCACITLYLGAPETLSASWCFVLKGVEIISSPSSPCTSISGP